MGKLLFLRKIGHIVASVITILPSWNVRSIITALRGLYFADVI